MIEIKPMDESYIHIDCMHRGPVDPSSPPRRLVHWKDAPDLPPHPWSDETIAELAKKYGRLAEGWGGDPSREFMREMIQRHGSCAMLAWEEGKVVEEVRKGYKLHDRVLRPSMVKVGKRKEEKAEGQ